MVSFFNIRMQIDIIQHSRNVLVILLPIYKKSYQKLGKTTQWTLINMI